MKTSPSTHALTILTALASSICCVTPVLAVVAGASGIASSFTWLEPARPFLVGATVVGLGIAWYGALMPKKEVTCYCATDTTKLSFWQSKYSLNIITVLAVLLLTFPMYSFIFFPKAEKNLSSIQMGSMQTVEFTIKGMTCSGCEKPVSAQINKLNGIKADSVSYAKSNAVVKFDNSKTTTDQITKAINSTGYTVMKQEVK